MISTHILDLESGFPAKDVDVRLERLMGQDWRVVQELKTNEDGRISFDCRAEAGSYRLTFHIEEYFKGKREDSFFVCAPVEFNIEDTNRKYHVPLLLSPYGYSTYRGS